MNRLAPAMAAGIVAFDPDAIAFASETHDSLAALFFAPERAERTR